MVILNTDISLFIISHLDLVLYRKLILVNKWFFDTYSGSYCSYWLEKHKIIDNIDTILINLFGYNTLIDAPLISINDINTIDKSNKMKNSLFCYSSILLGYDTHKRIYIILDSSRKTKYPESLDIIYQVDTNNSNIWKYYSFNGIIQKYNQPNKFIRKGYFLNLDGNFPYLSDYNDYQTIKKYIK